MPFTFCHPAIVLPMNRIKGISLTGLIAGSVVPDFEYFIRMTDKRVYLHNWSGLLWFDVPLALLLTFLFHNIARNYLINNAPFSFQKRLHRYLYFNWTPYFRKRWLPIVICVILGAASHLLWDNFTHENGYFVTRIPFLASTLDLGFIKVEGHMLLQVISSIVGGLVILYAIWQLPVDHKAYVQLHIYRYWIVVISITFFISIIKITLSVGHEIEDFIIPAISAFLYSLILTPLLIQLRPAIYKNKRRNAGKVIQ